jgi:alpha-galactosidase
MALSLACSPMKLLTSPAAHSLGMLFFSSLAAFAQAPVASPAPAFWNWASKPPMGWNSYDAWGGSVTEEQTLANAQYMRDHLLSHGWQYIVIDFRWYDDVSPNNDGDLNKERAGARLNTDRYGRLLPAPNRFPSAAGGQGFKPLADKLHAMGLKFGLHMMRGIPRQDVAAKTSIEGSSWNAADAGDPQNKCSWCPDMFGVRDNAAGQAWYNSTFRLYASWGLDFIKVDDLSNPYYGDEIAMIRQAIDQCGRRIVFSTSPGPTDPVHADGIKMLANQWRISNDFWDRWKDLDHQFDLLAKWQGVGGPGHFPDSDMIPFGHVGIKCTVTGPDRQTRFTKDEQLTLMSLWSLASSPLMLGDNLPDTDDWTASLLTNDEVLAVDQDSLGVAARQVWQKDGLEVWVKDLKDGSKAIGLFNRSVREATIDLSWTEAGLKGKQRLRDLWQHEDLGSFDQTFSTTVPSHGVVLIRARSE